jgi:putative acetyltransferase
MKIRRFLSSDSEQIAQLFHDTIRSINSNDYSEKQVKAWAPDDIHFRDWEARCSSKLTLVAENNEIIAGFAELDDDGHIDCFYCHKDFLGQGVGRKLFKGIEKETRRRGLNKLYVEASITSKPFFLKIGFSVILEQTVETRGEKFINFLMEKYL